MNCELDSYLETIEPELKVLTRLFGYPESVWEEPKRFVPVTEEKDGLFRIVFEADGHRVEKFDTVYASLCKTYTKAVVDTVISWFETQS